MDASATSSSSLAHRRGKSSLSSTGSGAVRSRIAYPGGATIVSPPFPANKYIGNGQGSYGHDAQGSNGARAGMANGNVVPSFAHPNLGQADFGYKPQLAPLSTPSAALQHPNGSLDMSNGQTVGAGGSVARSRPRRPDTGEIKRVARIHYEELYKFLKSHLAKGQRGPRTNAREKLTRLSQQQFTELSTDVYDELMRRVTNARTGSEIPHLAVREEFHPKRNQARQKLATLPRTRFKDLSSDVFFELERRFPDLRDEFRPEISERERREEEEAAQRQRQRQNSILSNRDDDVGDSTIPTLVHDDDAGASVPQPSTSDVVIPAKSTLVEEQIALPYADQVGSEADGNAAAASSSYEDRRTSAFAGGDDGAASIRDSIVTNDQDNNRSTMYSQASSVGTGFYNGYAGSRATESVASPNIARSSQQADAMASFEIEKLKSDYEFRIATLQQKVTTLEARNTDTERERDDRLAALRSETESTSAQHEEEARSLKRLVEESQTHHASAKEELKVALQRLDELQTQNQQNVQQQLGGVAPAQLEQELNDVRREYGEQEGLVNELRSEVANLVEELRELSSRNDDLLNDKDSDQAIIRDLNTQVASYRRKYENAKTELRNLKATSQLFVQPPKTDDFMPPTESGAIADINLTAFQSSIDDLLAAARSKTPSNVLIAMKTVVLAATLITDDVSHFERRESGVEGETRDQVAQVKSRISNTLNNLMTACRNHASSHGLSPVSLLDAASSHVSAAIVDVVKLVKVRKATKEEAEEFEATFTQNGTLPNGLRPLLGAGSLANHSSPSVDLRRRQGGTDEDRLLLGTPGGETSGPSLMNGRSFSPRLRQGTTPIGRYSPVSYRGDITRKSSTGEGSWKTKGDRSRNASISSSSSHAQQTMNDRSTPAVPAISSALLRAASTQSTSSTSVPRSPNGGQATAQAGSATASSSMNSSGLQASIDDDLVGGKSFASSSDVASRDNVNPSNSMTNARYPSSQPLSDTLSPLPTPSSLLATPPPPLPPSDGMDESSEAYWAELRNYIEVQTEAIVHSIQALLSSIREGAQGNQLHENLTQITTIVSSIIAISKDNIPRAAAAAAKQTSSVSEGQSESVRASRAATASADGESILQELSEHCEKLIEMQAIGGQFDKSTKSNMASASYGVAKGLKALNGLLSMDE